MNLLTLIAAGLRQHPMVQLLNLMGLALGVALVVALVVASDQLRDAAQRDARGIDLVVGAPGSPLQLVLSAVYLADAPTGNIPATQWPRWQAHPLVAEALPLALGDSVAGHRLMGSAPGIRAFLGLELAQGAWWQEPGGVVLGAAVAHKQQLAVGDPVLARHGGAQGVGHDDQPLRVVGILAPSGRAVDRLVLTDLRTVWALHRHGHEEKADAAHAGASGHAPGHEGGHGHDHDGEAPGYAQAELAREEITALLLRFASPMGHGRLARTINAQPEVQAASPVTEMARLVGVFGALLLAAQGLAGLVVVVAGIGLFVTLYQALEQRRYDIALLRALGASRLRVGLLLVGEALFVASGAALAGWVLGYLALELLARAVPASVPLPLGGWDFVPASLWVFPAAVLIALLAAALPAWRAYRMDVPGVLAQHG